MNESQVAVVPVVTAEAYQTNRAAQTGCEAIGLAVGLDDLVDELKVFRAAHAQPIDGILTGGGLLVGGRYDRIFAVPFPGPGRFKLEVDAAVRRQHHDCFDGEPFLDAATVVVGIGERSEVRRAEEQGDRVQNRRLAHVAATENHVEAWDRSQGQRLDPAKPLDRQETNGGFEQARAVGDRGGRCCRFMRRRAVRLGLQSLLSASPWQPQADAGQFGEAKRRTGRPATRSLYQPTWTSATRWTALRSGSGGDGNA